MTLSDIHFHDSVLFRVIEDAEKHTLSLEVDYPVDWDNEVYERKHIVFTDVLDYQVHEGPFAGPPTLLEWSTAPHASGRVLVRLETDAGFRQFAFRDVSLSDAT